MIKNYIKFSDTWAGTQNSLATIEYYNDADEIVTDTLLATKYSIKNDSTELIDSVFNDCKVLTEIDLTGVTSIGRFAFQDCRINKIDLTGVTSIGDFAFEGSVLTEIDLTGVTSIGKSAFRYSLSLTTINCSESKLTTVGDSAFDECRKLSSNIEPLIKNLTSIPDFCFGNCYNIKLENFDSTATSIGNSAFRNCYNIYFDTLPNSITSIGSSTFKNCSKLYNLYLYDNNNLLTIGNYAFQKCNFSYVDLPNSLTSIGNYAFDNAIDSYELIIPDSVTSIGEYAFQYCNIGKIILPKNLTTLSKYTFHNNKSLKTINIPDSVTSIGNGAFASCNKLFEVNIPNSVVSIDNYAFGYTNLKFVTIPDSVTSIGDLAFVGSGLKTLLLSNQLITISKSLVSGCSELINIKIPDSVTTINSRAFYGCEKLTFINIPNSVTTIESGIFEGCNSLKKIYAESDESVETLKTIIGVNNPEYVALVESADKLSTVFQLDENDEKYIAVSHADVVYLNELNFEGKSKTLTEKLSQIPSFSEIVIQRDLDTEAILREQSDISLQQQIDKERSIWDGAEIPTLENYPFNTWYSDEERLRHVGDIYLVTDAASEKAGYSYKLTGTTDNFVWLEIADNDGALALKKFTELENVVIRKSSIYTTQPSNYQTDDCWILESAITINGISYIEGEILTAIDSSEIFEEIHWIKKVCYIDGNVVDSKLVLVNTNISNNATAIQTESETRATKDAEIELSIEEVRNIAVGNKSHWSGNAIPDLTNYPAVDWTTDELKNLHIGEIYLNVEPDGENEGKMWRFVETGGVYSWITVKDTDATKALAAAILAQNTADSKNTIWLEQPIKYKKGDLWKLNIPYTLDGNYYVIGTILIASEDSNSFVSSHWSIFNEINIGGVNLVNDSGKLIDNSLATNLINVYPNTIYFEQGKPYTISIEYNTLDSTNVAFSVRFSDTEQTSIMYVRVSGESYVTNNKRSRFSKTIIWTYESQEVHISSYLYDNSVNPIIVYPVIQYNIQIENGNIATDYTPAQSTAIMEVEYEDGTFETLNLVTAI